MEKALWNIVGDLLCKSGWTDVLVEANVATSGTADFYLNATHITRTHHAHQVTCLALSILLQSAFQLQSDETDHEKWGKLSLTKRPTFYF